MKTKISLLVLLIISLLISACGGTANTSQAATTNADGTPQLGGFGNAELSPATKLALGTLKLDGTDQPITPEQAAELVTLWQAYQALSNSETAATVELDAVIKQIEKAMTTEQIQAIEAMNITRESMAEIMQSLGLQFGRPGQNAEGTPDAAFQPGGEGGMMPPDGMPSDRDGTNRGGGMGMGPGGGGMPGGGIVPGGEVGGMGMAPDMQITPDASTQATMQARMQAQASRVNPMILQALIAMLESK